MMLTCKEVTRLLATSEAETAPVMRRILLRLHLMMCDDCRRYADELRRLGSLAREALGSPLDADRLSALERAIVEQARRDDDRSQGGDAR